MDRSLVKRLSVRSWAIAFVVFAMALPFIGPNSAKSEEHAKGSAPTHELLMKAYAQLESPSTMPIWPSPLINQAWDGTRPIPNVPSTSSWERATRISVRT